jgi:hypothetical protein
VPTLREVVTKAQQMRADGKEPVPFLKAFTGGADIKRAGRDAAVAEGAMETWEQARDVYLLKDNARDKWRSYRSALGSVPGSPLEEDFLQLH